MGKAVAMKKKKVLSKSGAISEKEASGAAEPAAKRPPMKKLKRKKKKAAKASEPAKSTANAEPEEKPISCAMCDGLMPLEGKMRCRGCGRIMLPEAEAS
ncbi:unnamed protein product [Symbiodinium sp. CCMP2592]|nr:unnamed protein product [Symbiodinium sp. CCMP2592]